MAPGIAVENLPHCPTRIQTHTHVLHSHKTSSSRFTGLELHYHPDTEKMFTGHKKTLVLSKQIE